MKTDVHGLSTRKAEVLALVCTGATNGEIADALFVSVNTVETHVRELLVFTRCRNRTQLAAWGAQSGYAKALDQKATEIRGVNARCKRQATIARRPAVSRYRHRVEERT